MRMRITPTPRNTHWGIILLVLLIFSNSNSYSQENEEFADWLFRNGFYDFANYEYLKKLYLSENENAILVAGLYNKIAKCYLMTERYDKGIKWCLAAIQNKQGEVLPELYVTYALIQMHSGSYDESIAILNDDRILKGEHRSRGLFLLGCSAAHKWELKRADDYWDGIPSGDALYLTASRYRYYTNEAADQRFLNQNLGTLLGVIPGLGYCYSGHYKTAISSFIVISLTSWATYRAFDKDIDGIGYLSGFLAVGWYSGSIYGSYWACKRHNDFHKKQYLKKIRY